MPRVLQGTTLGGLTGVLLGTRGIREGREVLLGAREERYYLVQGVSQGTTLAGGF